VFEVIAGDVLAMLAELNGKTVKWTGMQAGEKAFNNELGAQVEPSHLMDDFGPQVLLGASHQFLVRIPPPARSRPRKKSLDHPPGKRQRSFGPGIGKGLWWPARPSLRRRLHRGSGG